MDSSDDEILKSPRSTPTESIRGNGGESAANNEVKNEDEISECAAMDVIEKSPYEPMLNAEKGVQLFTDVKNLLAESEDDGSVSSNTTKVFGPKHACCLVKTIGKCQNS